MLYVCAGMVRCLLSRHSERSCLHSGLRHLLFRQLRVCQDHAAADLRDQVHDWIFTFCTLYFFAPFSLPGMLLPSLYFFVCSLFFFLRCFISRMFLILLFLRCLMVYVITLKRRDSSVIMGCQHTGSFLHHLDPNQKKWLLFSSADCKGHHQKSIQKPQRLFALYLEQVWWWCLIVSVWAAF